MADILIEADWSGWLVCVHNHLGEAVATVPFPRPAPVVVPFLPPVAESVWNGRVMN
jgi:hypothetical protein